MSLFSFTILTLFSFSLWTKIKPIFRKVILSKTLEPTRNTFKDKRQTEFPLFPITDMITWIFWQLTLAGKQDPLSCPSAGKSQVKRSRFRCFVWPVLCLWMKDTLDPRPDGDMKNNVDSLCVKIIDKNRSTIIHDLWPKTVEETKTRNPRGLCWRQRWEITRANHNFELWLQVVFNPQFYGGRVAL